MEGVPFPLDNSKVRLCDHSPSSWISGKKMTSNYQLGLGLLQEFSKFLHGCQVLFQLADALAGTCTESL